MTISPLARQPEVIIGVDAHKSTHHAVILTSAGQRIADQEFPATTHGYADLLSWARAHGHIQAFGWNLPALTLQDLGSAEGFLVESGVYAARTTASIIMASNSTGVSFPSPRCFRLR